MEKNSGEKSYKSIYKIIQNQIKDYVINKFISIISLQNNEIKEIKKTNNILKNNFIHLLKKVFINRNIQKFNNNRPNSQNKNILNSSMKLTDFTKYTQTNYHSIITNDSISFRSSSIDNKVSKTLLSIMNKGKLSESFISKKNIPISKDIILKKSHHKSQSQNLLLSEKKFNSSLLYPKQSQKFIPSDLIKKNSNEINDKNFLKIKMRNTDKIYPKYRKRVYKFKYSEKSLVSYNSDDPITNSKSNKIEEKKDLEKKNKIRIIRNPHSNRSGFLINKI